MQYYSPNNEANFPFIPIPPVFPRSQIVGEGDVTSVTLPDGTLQLFFIPGSWTTCFGNYQWGAVPAWFIRTIPNLFPAPQPFASDCRDITQASKTYLQNNAVKEDISKYQLQFHSDRPTSSTDLHYFSQPAHPFAWQPRQSVETQADPGRPCEACCRACGCRPDHATLQPRTSEMSIDGNEDKPTCSCHRKVNKVRFSADGVVYDKVCDNCKNKCNAMRSTSDKSN